LILFVVWYGVNPPPPPPGADLRAEIAKLKLEKSQLQTDLADRERRLEYWRRTFNRDLPGSDQEMWAAIREYLGSHPGEAKTLLADIIGGPGSPACLPEPRGNTLLYVEVIDGRVTHQPNRLVARWNTLLYVEVIDGSTRVEVLREPVELNTTLRALGVAAIIKGQVVTDSDRIDALLASSTKSTISRNGKVASCRFDYSLAYRSADDYLRARTKFEKYLYPARLTQVRQ
jgi:hypothetical protein